MKIGIVIIAFLALLLIGGFGYFVFADVPVAQTQVSKEIPNERFK